MDTNRDALVADPPGAASTPTGSSPTAASSTTTRASRPSASSSRTRSWTRSQSYDIDGVHFDDYFYPYPVAGQPVPDDATFAQYGAGFTDKADWRRHNTDLLISELDQTDPRGQAVGEVRRQPLRRLAQHRHRPGGLGHHRRRADLRRPVRRHPEVGARGVARLHRPAGLLGDRVRAGRLRQARALVERPGPRHRRPALHRPGDVQGRHVDPVARLDRGPDTR